MRSRSSAARQLFEVPPSLLCQGLLRPPRSLLPLMACHSDKCLAKVSWGCSKGQWKQCTRKPKPGLQVCGIHLRCAPLGLLGDEENQMVSKGVAEEQAHVEAQQGAKAVDEPQGSHQWEEEEKEEEKDEEDEEEGGSAQGDASGEDQEPAIKKPKYSMQHISEYFDTQAKAKDKKSQGPSYLIQYCAFSEQLPFKALPPSAKASIQTPGGQMFVSEQVLKAWLSHIRFGGGPVGEAVYPSGHTKQLAILLKGLKEELKSCGLSWADLPEWVWQESSSLAQLFRDWKKVDMTTEEPASRRLSISPATIESYCHKVAIAIMERKATAVEIEEALLLRLQSARSHRHVNMPGGIKVSDHGCDHRDGTEVHWVTAICSKPLGSMKIEGIANAKGKVKFLITDELTLRLWKAWLEELPCDIDPATSFLFPKQGKENFDWSVPLTRDQHDRAVQRMAKIMDLSLTPEEIGKLTSKSVRSGVSAEVARVVRDTLTELNRKHGRASSSSMDLSVYCPKEVLMEPGPLFGNTEQIAAKLQSSLAEHFAKKKTELLCRACGFPACPCHACRHPKRCPHVCWLAGKCGPKPKHGFKETDEQLATRVAAWLRFGIDGLPEFENGVYTWEG